MIGPCYPTLAENRGKAKIRNTAGMGHRLGRDGAKREDQDQMIPMTILMILRNDIEKARKGQGNEAGKAIGAREASKTTTHLIRMDLPVDLLLGRAGR